MSAQFVLARYVWFALTLAFFVWFLVYLTKLEKIGCECALTWKRKFIMAYFFFALTINIVLLVIPGLGTSLILSGLVVVFAFAFLIVTIQYVTELKRKKCECSEDFARTVLFYYAIVSAITFAIMVASLVMLILTLRSIDVATVQENRRFRNLNKN